MNRKLVICWDRPYARFQYKPLLLFYLPHFIFLERREVTIILKRRWKIRLSNTIKLEMQQPDTKPLNKYIAPLKHTPNMKLKFQTMRTTQSLQTPQLKYDGCTPPLDYYILHLMDSPQVGSCTIASCRSPPPSQPCQLPHFILRLSVLPATAISNWQIEAKKKDTTHMIHPIPQRTPRHNIS